MAKEVIVECKGVSKCYTMGTQKVYALKDMNLEIYKGEYLSVMGPSGSGKSTLFNMIGALDKPSEGTVKIGGVDLTKQTSDQLAYFRNHHIGYIFQAFNLIPSLTTLRNVMLPLLLAGKSYEESEKRAKEMLETVGLAKRINHRPGELSGGQQQRVAIARGLSMNPTIMLADEPTANLDLHTGEDIIKLLKTCSKEYKMTIITATHDHKMLDKSDRVLWIKDGTKERLEDRKNLNIKIGNIS